MKKRNTNKKKGFTLIELVVVIAIIGILAAVITPRIRTSLLKARDGRAIASLDAIRTATNVYFAEKGTVLNPAAVDAANSAKVTNITMKELKILKDAGYLDEKSVKKLDPTTAKALTDTTVATVEVGSVATKTLCEKGQFAPGKLELHFTNDGVGVDFETTTTAGSEEYDTNCTPWADK